MTSVSPPGKPAHLMTYNDFDLLETYLPTTPTTYEYNNDRKVTRITRPDMSVIDYTYNATTGRLTNIQTPSGNYTFVPNSLWQYEDQATSPDGVVNTFTHNGELVTSVATSGPTTGTISYTYNNNFLVSSYQVLNGAAISYTFDNDMLPVTIGDAVLTRNIITGAVKRVKVGRVIEQIDRNPFGELESLESRHGGTNANFYTTAFTRDDLGRISTKVETKQANTPVTYSYTYDLNGRLTDVVRDGITIGHYEYDLNGNRTLTTQLGVSTSATYNDLDQLLTFGTKNYTYSANGEVAAVTDTAAIPMGSVSYTYDSFGVLKSATLPNGNVISYLHDSQGRPVARKVNGAIQKQYVWLDGLKLAAELDSTGSVVLQFVYGTKENVPDYLIKAGIKYKLVTDHLGSVVMVIKTTNGIVVQEIAYDEFGRELSNTNPSFQPFGFAGGIYDSDTKLVHFGARDYDAETGRWTAKDPIRFAGGDFNLYGYVLGDPVNFIDPLGLYDEDPNKNWAENRFDQLRDYLDSLRDGAKEKRDAVKDWGEKNIDELKKLLEQDDPNDPNREPNSCPPK